MSTIPVEVNARLEALADWQDKETAFLSWVLAPLIVVQVMHLSFFLGTTSDAVTVVCNAAPAAALGFYLVQVIARFRRERNILVDAA